MAEKSDIQIYKSIILMRNLMTKRNGARQGVVEEVVEGEQEGGQGGGLAPLAQQAAQPLHLQQVGQGLHSGKGCAGGSLFETPANLQAAQLTFSKSASLDQVPGGGWHLHIAKLRGKNTVTKTATIGNTKSKDFEVGWGRSGRVSR